MFAKVDAGVAAAVMSSESSVLEKDGPVSSDDSVEKKLIQNQGLCPLSNSYSVACSLKV